MRIVMKGFVFALDMDKAIDSITAACSQCSALKKVLHFATQQIKFWSTWDHWQHICCWRYEARNTAHIYYAVMLFLLHYCPNYWGRESRDTPSRNHPILYRAKTQGWPLCCCSYWSIPWISSIGQWSNFKVSSDLNWARTPQEWQKNLSQNVQSKQTGTYTENWSHRKSGILSAVIAWCCNRNSSI